MFYVIFIDFFESLSFLFNDRRVENFLYPTRCRSCLSVRDKNHISDVADGGAKP